MDIRSSMEGLRTLLGVNPAAPTAAQGKSVPSATASGITSDRATLSSAASEISDAATGEDVRMDKVSQVQQALAAGTYDVSASAVASKVVDAMLGGQ
ncbi:MAG: flagellar biosynthesis anti-sigma factor FlgM [Terracidiphilus sp.]